MVDHLNKFIKQESATTHKPQQEQASPEASPLVDLQRLVGNQGVQRMLGNGQLSAPQQPSTFIQTKLSVGAADDPYEREADAVAQQVVHGPAPDVAQRAGEEEEMAMKRIQRQESGEMEDEEAALKRIQRAGMEEEQPLQAKRIQREEIEEPLQAKRIQREGAEDELAMKRIQRQESGEMEDEEMALKRDVVQRKDMEGAFDVGGDVEEQINSQKGGGETLPDESRGFFESRFGHDFGNVNVHTDANSDNLNRSLQARAFTTGSDIFFRQGEYNPGSDSGKELLAHELTHVVQQGGAQVQSKPEDKE